MTEEEIKKIADDLDNKIKSEYDEGFKAAFKDVKDILTGWQSSKPPSYRAGYLEGMKMVLTKYNVLIYSTGKLYKYETEVE